jgi:hypothetical protein
MKKKALSILVAVSLFTTQVSAASLKDFFYSNGTAPSTSSIQGTHYYFGGNYELRFKNNTYAFKPWFNGSPPRFHIGCNGVSISGGFISLLGLDDIKKQLDHASVAFAWGIIMAIKASLPIVAQVFETIQKWARTIQKLLQNACNMGQALTRHIVKGDAPQSINNLFSEAAGDEGFTKQKSILNSLNEKADFINKKVDEFIESGDDRAKSLANSLLANKIKGSTISLATFYFGKYLPNIDDNKQALVTGYLSDIYSKKIGSHKLNIDNNDEFERNVLFHKLALLVFGEVGINTKSFDELTKIVDSNGEVNGDKLKGSILKTLTGMASSQKIVAVPIRPVISADNAYEFLMYGAKEVAKNNNHCDDNECWTNDLRCLYIYGPTNTAVNKSSKESSKSKDKIKVFTLVSAEDSNGQSSKTINIKWQGFYQESLDAIRNLVKKQAGLNNYAFIGKAPISEGNNKFLFKGMGKYINILALLAKKRGGETDYIYYLEKLLAKRNAQTQTFLLINNIVSYMKTLMGDPSVDFGPQAQQTIAQYLKNAEAIQENIMKNVTGTLKIDDSIYKLDKMFDKIYKSIKEENMKNVGF